MTNVLKIYIIRQFYSRRKYYNIILFIIVDGLLFIWLSYGNRLYYSKSNDCMYNEGTKYLIQFMAAMLAIGYFLQIVYILILVSFPCIYIFSSNSRANN